MLQDPTGEKCLLAKIDEEIATAAQAAEAGDDGADCNENSANDADADMHDSSPKNAEREKQLENSQQIIDDLQEKSNDKLF